MKTNYTKTAIKELLKEVGHPTDWERIVRIVDSLAVRYGFAKPKLDPSKPVYTMVSALAGYEPRAE